MGRTKRIVCLLVICSCFTNAPIPLLSRYERDWLRDGAYHRDQQGPRLPGVAHRKYKHHSQETATSENITGVCEHSQLAPPPIMTMASFFSSSHELLVTEIEHGLICATEIETYCALLWMRMFTDT